MGDLAEGNQSMGKPKQTPDVEIAPPLAAAFMALGLPRSAWPGTRAKMTDAVAGQLAATIVEGSATPATQAAYQQWQVDRRQKIRAAEKVAAAEPVFDRVEVVAANVETTATVGTHDGTLAPDWPAEEAEPPAAEADDGSKDSPPVPTDLPAT